jgi:hypothetical protein
VKTLAPAPGPSAPHSKHGSTAPIAAESPRPIGVRAPPAVAEDDAVDRKLAVHLVEKRRYAVPVDNDGVEGAAAQAGESDAIPVWALIDALRPITWRGESAASARAQPARCGDPGRGRGCLSIAKCASGPAAACFRVARANRHLCNGHCRCEGTPR